MSTLFQSEPDPMRQVSLRYFNVFRLIIAGVFVTLGAELELGREAPNWMTAISASYLALVLLLGFPDALRRFGFERVITVQVIIDLLMLALVMSISGGYRSGMAVMMMIYIAGAGLVANGRFVMFFAAFATVAVLIENVWRTVDDRGGADFFQVGILGVGFFAVAFLAHLLARRASANASLAQVRGQALGRAQAVNERIIRDMADGVLVLSPKGMIRKFNPRAAELLGMPLREHLPMVNVDVNFPALCEEAYVGAGVVSRIGPGGRLLRCRVINADVDPDLEVASDHEGGDQVVYLTAYDEIQNQIQQQKLAALGRLTASMAHEIRNPLSAVMQAADLLADEKRAEMRTRLSRIIVDNGRRIERLVREVLALGRRDQVLAEPLVVADFLQQMIDEMTLRGDDERALFALDAAPDAVLLFDRTHLHQIFGNLLHNARRYCSGQPDAIRIQILGGEGAVVVHVSDDGPGVTEEGQVSLFEPFFTSDPKGTGLGLYIARELAEANDALLEFVGNTPGAHFVLTARSAR